MTELVLIAAVAENRIIGDNGKVPWRIPEDMARFKRLTMGEKERGHPVIMGRHTWDSILEKNRPLADRPNVVVSRIMDPRAYPQIIVCNSILKAIVEASKLDYSLYCIGGEQVYNQTIGLATRLEITEVHKNFDGDARFPDILGNIWKETFRENHETDDFAYSFVTYKRR